MLLALLQVSVATLYAIMQSQNKDSALETCITCSYVVMRRCVVWVVCKGILEAGFRISIRHVPVLGIQSLMLMILQAPAFAEPGQIHYL